MSMNSCTWLTKLLVLVVLEIGEVPKILSYHDNVCVGTMTVNGVQSATSLGSAAWDVFRNDTDHIAGVLAGQPSQVKNTTIHKLTVYPITYKLGDVTDANNLLFGWFHVKIEIDTSSDPRTKGMSLLILQPWVTYFSTYVAGEFVATRFANQCREKFGPGFDHSDYQRSLSPCFFAPLEATMVPRTILYTDNGSGKDIQDSTYTFRTDFPECGLMNVESPFQFRLYAAQRADWEKLGLHWVFQTKIFFSNSVYGAYDPEPPRLVSVSCNKEAGPDNVPWISRTEDDKDVQPMITSSCITELDIEKNINRFYGRCSSAGTDYDVGTKVFYRCANRANHMKEYPNVTEVLDPNGCQACEKAKSITRRYGITASSKIGRYVWAYRITHGIAMTIGTIFVIPVGTLFARYYKETHMSHRLLGLHVWYGVHISSGMTGFSVLLSGLVAGTVARAFFGFSHHRIAIIHVVLGWISIVVYLFALCLSPFRVYIMSKRWILILAHFVLGWACRILWAFCLLTSFYIPGSPAAIKDVHVNFRVDFDMVIVLVWIIVDIAVHVILQLRMNKLEEDYPRNYLFAVPIPIVRPTYRMDTPDTKFRNVAIIVYEVISLLCAVILSLLMCYRDPSGRYFGKMSYTHNPSGTFNSLFTDMLYNDHEG